MFAAALLGGCASQSATQAPSAVAAAATRTPSATAEPTPEITPTPTPVVYVSLASRAWAELVKSPETYRGKAYKVWGCISQFDAGTGLNKFRAQASYQRQKYWYPDAVNSFFLGDPDKLSDFVEGNIVSMNVLSLGSYSYDAVGGNRTVPMFQIVTIRRLPGSC